MPRRSRSHLDWQPEAQRSGLRLSLPEGDSERFDDNIESENGAANPEESTSTTEKNPAELYADKKLFALMSEARSVVRDLRGPDVLGPEAQVT